VQSVSQSVYNQLLCSLSAPGGVCQLISNADCLLGYSLSAQLQFVSSAHFQVVNSAVSLAAICQFSCQLSCNLWTKPSAQVQFVNSAVSSAATCQLSCPLRCKLSAQLHSVGRLDPLPSFSILPPKLWAVFLVATNQSRVHAATVHCMTRPVQATTCVPSLSNTMILQCVYRRHGWTAVTSYETEQFRSCPIGPGRNSVIMNGYKNYDLVNSSQ